MWRVSIASALAQLCDRRPIGDHFALLRFGAMAGHCEFILQSLCFGGPTPPTDQTTCHGQTFRTCPAVLKCGERHPAAGRWPDPCGSGLVPNRAGPRVVPKASIRGADPSVSSYAHPLRGFGVPSLPSSALRGSVLVNVPCGCFSCLAALALPSRGRGRCQVVARCERWRRAPQHRDPASSASSATSVLRVRILRGARLRRRSRAAGGRQRRSRPRHRPRPLEAAPHRRVDDEGSQDGPRSARCLGVVARRRGRGVERRGGRGTRQPDGRPSACARAGLQIRVAVS